jgi:hypothetical protein
VTEQEDIEQRLARLSGATEGMRPSAGFSARVMLALEADAQAAPSIFETAWFSARRLVPVAAIAAALAVVWAVQVDGTVDDSLATTYASIGLE